MSMYMEQYHVVVRVNSKWQYMYILKKVKGVANRISLIREILCPLNASIYTIHEKCAPRKFNAIDGIHAQLNA